MNKQRDKFIMSLLAMAIMVSTAVTMAQASDTKEKDAKELQLFSQAKISLSEAIKAAEQKVGGKAMEAEIDDEASSVQFEIEVVNEGKVHNVLVDGNTGKVLKVSLSDESNEGAENEKQ
ncbi:MAG: PepSY domain-containing protein [Methylococcaceae bacterium]|nr:PepSY domain-containing protein [Methylococcaceae bacterium]MDZ4156230.1 PepSY domain-containing protein [Methylococcales bacterium]MDP2393808.1 PepSY domain-containing protein [Methylococcaceae bacterium]MDP3019834.1 PepSY domain-containing protein [Methylococcaceae bacterium]MDP3389561.1 PepSY domain-containing protein [Methylococcaceae bacterium]